MKRILYFMPASNGDVFMSTAIIDGVKKKYPDSLIDFVTDKQYFDLLKGDKNLNKIYSFTRKRSTYDHWDKIQRLGKYQIVLMPFTLTQIHRFSNWWQAGNGVNLIELYAMYCNVEIGNFYIRSDSIKLPVGNYVTVHTGSGNTQWSARKYLKWQEIVNELKKSFKVVQIGKKDEALLEGVIDFRGKTKYPQLSYLIKNAYWHIGIDSFPMWLAGANGTNLLILFGSSGAINSGFPEKLKKDGQKLIYIETKTRNECRCPCYYADCKMDLTHPCINFIKPETVINAINENFF